MNKKITIGLFNDSFYPMIDWVVSVVHNYGIQLSKYANVIVFAPRYLGKTYDDTKFPYKVIRCASLQIPFFDYALPIPQIDVSFKNELEKYKLDIVHVHSPFTIWRVWLQYAQKHNIPCIATMHSQFKQDLQKEIKSEFLSDFINENLIIKFFESCDECWAVNKNVARIFHEDYGYNWEPKVMNNATEMQPVTDLKLAKDFINNKYNIWDNEKVFLFVWRINILKNILFIADAIKILKEKRPWLKFKMLYVWSWEDEWKLKRYIKKMELENNAILCWRCTDRQELAYFYARADLFLFPSLYDASSIVQIEAASQGTPWVFLKWAATAATITDNVNWFLSEPSPLAYADKIIEILEDSQLYDEVSKNAKKDLYKNRESCIQEVYPLYLQWIQKKKNNS